MPTIGKLKQAIAYDKNLSKNYDFEPNMSIPKSNPYYTFALNQKLMAANSQTGKDLILQATPPKNARTNPMTPKIKFVKNAGSRTSKRTTSKRRTIKNKRKRNNKSNRK
jgi:hypothetical protein